MSEPRRHHVADETLPRAKLARWRWHLPVVWVVPIVAAFVAGYLVVDRVRELGSTITIKFQDGGGLRIGQTPLKYRGVPIGEVTEVRLSEDNQHVLVKVRLQRSAASIAREGSRFWIVRPEVGIGNISGLGTVITGPEIQVLPGSGEPVLEFVGLERASAVADDEGLKIVLRANQRESVRLHSPVYYRGIEVGTVYDLQLGANATAVDIHVFIQQRYAKLVRHGSKFWNVSGAAVSGGLFKGVNIKIESLSALVTGGIAFASPPEPNVRPVPDGTAFSLYSGPTKEWLGWTPPIPISPEK